MGRTQRSARQVAPLKPVCILWIDPSIDEVEQHIKMLVERGNLVDHAISLAQARRMARLKRYDVVIIELMLPDALGTEAWCWFSKRQRNLRGVMTTSAPSLHKFVRVSSERLLAYLLKPIDNRTLVRIVSRENNDAQVVAAGRRSVRRSVPSPQRGQRQGELET